MIDGSGSDFDKLFSVMANQRRRYVLYYLHDTARDAVECSKLAEVVAQWETATGDEPSDDHQEEVKIALQHNHLPKMEAHGIIDYDPRSEMIRYRDDLSKQGWLEEAKTEELDHV